MSILVSLPHESIPYFREIYNGREIFLGHDPKGHQIGSGGGLIHLLRSQKEDNKGGKRIVINAGGESRRLPAYGAYGKVLIPIPVMKWSRGQRIDQRLFDLQCDYLQRISAASPSSLTTMVASGDALISLPARLPKIPEADIVCLGLWGMAQTAQKHGVFVCKKEGGSELVCMLQKPSLEVIEVYSQQYHLLIDSGVWLFSDRAIKAIEELVRQSPNGYLDLYTDIGALLGSDPLKKGAKTLGLTTAVWIVDEAKFFHFGSAEDLISSIYALQNMVVAQDNVMPSYLQRHHSIFALNARVSYDFTSSNREIWIENSTIAKNWHLSQKHILTGIPESAIDVNLPEGYCVDIVPLHSGEYCLRLYGYNDPMRGALCDEGTIYLGASAKKRLEAMGIALKEWHTDIFDAPIHPIISSPEEAMELLPRLLSGSISQQMRCLSPRELLSAYDLTKAERDRRVYLYDNLDSMQKNINSVFYQTDLSHTAELIANSSRRYDFSSAIKPSISLVQMHHQMFLAQLDRLSGEDPKVHTEAAYHELQKILSSSLHQEVIPSHQTIHKDQIIWARSPVRIDLAGGWTDTPPYCIYEGGSVINVAQNINHQEPLQVYVKKSETHTIILRSIDLGVEERITSMSELSEYQKLGSPFAIPKAALVLCGLNEQKTFDELIQLGGIEITMLSTLPAGSGLGVSSILAATTISALNSYFALGWDRHKVGVMTLLLEQLLTTCGGWQDQYGGIYGGLKLLTTTKGGHQIPDIEWLPNTLFTDPEYCNCQILFYTGITRIAKHILGNIVENMFLNHHETLSLLGEMREHTIMMRDVISRLKFEEYGRLVKESWHFNKRLDIGTSNEDIEYIVRLIDDYTLGYKLTGAGGGGFMYIIAKDPTAAIKIRTLLSEEYKKRQPSSRIVDMSLSDLGLQVTKS